MTAESINPSPAAIWVIRCFAVEPGPPKASMWLDWMLAPAEVPATTIPRSWAATIASPRGVPQTIAESLSWLPPVMKIPVTSSSTASSSGSCESSRLSGRTATTSAAPSRRKRASYTSVTSGPSEEAEGMTAIRASAPPARFTNSLRMVRPRSLSSAPPMIIRGPLGIGATLG